MNFDHVNLVTRDMAKARKFYGEVLGLRESFDTVLEGEWIDAVTGLKEVRAHCVFFEFEDGGRLELLEYQTPHDETKPTSQPNTSGFRHIAWTVENIDEWVEKLVQAEVKLVSLPVEVPFPVGGKTKRLCYFHDFEGNLLELAEYK